MNAAAATDFHILIFLALPMGTGREILTPRTTDHFGAFFSSSSLRFAKGLCVATGTPTAGTGLLPVRAASNCRWCSLSWQYRHSSSQLLPSGGLLPWLWSRWWTVSSRRFEYVNSRPQRPQIQG